MADPGTFAGLAVEADSRSLCAPSSCLRMAWLTGDSWKEKAAGTAAAARSRALEKNFIVEKSLEKATQSVVSFVITSSQGMSRVQIARGEEQPRPSFVGRSSAFAVDDVARFEDDGRWFVFRL